MASADFTIPEYNPTEEEAAINRIRFAGYATAVLIWPIGLCYALYIAVAQRTARIRRHAIGVAGVSLLTAAVCITAVILITSVAPNTKAVGDLRSILDSNNIAYTSVDGCTHSVGNQYICSVTTSNGQQTVTLTDDGKGYAYEQGMN